MQAVRPAGAVGREAWQRPRVGRRRKTTWAWLVLEPERLVLVLVPVPVRPLLEQLEQQPGQARQEQQEFVRQVPAGLVLPAGGLTVFLALA